MAYRNGLRVPATLFEAAAWHYTIAVTCGRCQRREVFHAAALWALSQRKGWSERIGEIAEHFRCTACHRRVGRADYCTDAVTADYLPMPSDEQWKRAIRRFRS